MLSKNSNIIYEAIYHSLVSLVIDKKPLIEVSRELYDSLSKLDEVPIKIYCESPDYKEPEYSHKNEDACMDLRARWIERKIDRIICHTGIHIELPKNYDLKIYPRSSIVNTGWCIPNSPGVIDSGYRGEILVVFRHPNGIDREEFPFKEGEKIAQCQAINYQIVKWQRVTSYEDLSISKRGDNGYGSTGKF